MSIILDSQSTQSDFRRGPYWYHESPFLPFGDSGGNHVGAPSLKASAMRGLLSDQSLINAGLFKHVPWKMAREIWEYLGTRGKQTLLMWQIMSTRYPKEFQRVSPLYSLRVRVPAKSIGSYIKMMDSSPENWDAVLSMSTAYASISDLVNVTQIKGLVALEINNEKREPIGLVVSNSHISAGMDDNLVHTWLQEVQSTGHLRQLQVLRLYEQKHLTSNIFWMLKGFPQLKLVILYQCPIITRYLNQKIEKSQDAALENDWVIRRFDRFPHESRRDCALKHLGPLLEVYRQIAESQAQGAESQTPLLKPCRSLLEFAIPYPTYDDPEKLQRRAHYAAKSIFIMTRADVSNRKRAPPHEERRPRDHGKRVMRKQRPNDTMDLLAEFL
ncbi:hypothetical protein PDE_02673 [Penicillium oxalicum 114-2]|uniref:Uncharacterized protein n=1 Tax=Penicillium oxalicum (strain 114-2 / CGMCC 5302) TaxID=933388 RepID=S7ZBW3_PENO1|nr:hypothetical protein PDE_02673 [Penicillium oxalicum 114-2]